MKITTERDIDGAVARTLRKHDGLSQSKFWSEIGITQSGGCRYESGNPVPKPIRTLIFLRYVAGIKIDVTSNEGAQSMIRLGHLQSAYSDPDKAKLGDTISAAMKSLQSASRALSKVGKKGGE